MLIFFDFAVFPFCVCLGFVYLLSIHLLHWWIAGLLDLFFSVFFVVCYVASFVGPAFPVLASRLFLSL